MSETVTVLDPHGNLGTMDAAEAQTAIAQSGFKIATPEMVANFEASQRQDTLGSTAKAFGLGAARGLTFGGSDLALTKSGLMTPEQVKEYQDFHGTASTAGEMTGIAAGSLMPGFAEAKGALGTAGAVIGAPVKAVSRLAGAITEGAAPIGEGIAKLVANPETSALANKIISKAIPSALGSAVEGAVYGGGQMVSESALGDPGLTAEKVISTIGMQALLGGAAGAFFGGAGGAFEHVFPPINSEVDIAKASAGDLSSAVKISSTPEEHAKFMDGLAKKLPKEELEAFKERSLRLGIDPDSFPALQSASPEVRDSWSSMVNSSVPTYSGVKQRHQIIEAFEKIDASVKDAVNVAEDVGTKIETGAALRESLSKKFGEAGEANAAEFKALEPFKQEIKLTDRTTGRLSKNIMALGDEHVLFGENLAYVKAIAKNLDRIDDLDGLQKLRTQVRTSAPMQGKWLAGVIQQKLDGIEERAIKRWADSSFVLPENKKLFMGVHDDIVAARKGYRAIAEKAEQLGESLKGTKFKGVGGLLDHLDKVNEEKFVRDLFQKGNYKALTTFKENFPEEFEIVRNYQRKRIADQAALGAKENDHRGFTSSVIKEVFGKGGKGGLEPEVRATLFSPKELQTLEDARGWLSSVPHNVNPSGTAHTQALNEFFHSPISVGIANARDFAKERFIKKLSIESPETSKTLSILTTLEKAARSTSKKIVSNSKEIFVEAMRREGAPKSAVGIGTVLNKEDKHKEFKKTEAMIEDIAASPEKAIEHLEKLTGGIYAHAPNVSGEIQAATSRMISFLSDKLPKPPQQGTFDQKWETPHSEVAKFNRYLEAVKNPVGILKSAAKGSVTSEELEVLTQVFPKIHEEIKTTLMHHLADGAKVPYQRRMALNAILGGSGDRSLAPNSIMANQQALTGIGKEQADQKVKMSQQGLGKLTNSDRMMTAFQSNLDREKP